MNFNNIPMGLRVPLFFGEISVNGNSPIGGSHGPLPPSISCDGATQDIYFPYITGYWRFFVDGRLIDGIPPQQSGANDLIYYLKTEYPEIYNGDFDGFFWVENLSDTPHRFEFVPVNDPEVPNSFTPPSNNPTFIEHPDGSLTFCLAAKSNQISCDGATSSFKWAYAVKDGAASAIALKTYVDGVQRDIINDPPEWLTREILDEMPEGEVPEGFNIANGVYKFNIYDSHNHRLELEILNPDFFRSVVSDNPTLIQMTDKLGEHVGVCLAPPANQISCDGATPLARFTDDGVFDITVNGVYYENPSLLTCKQMVDHYPTLAEVLLVNGDGETLFTNKTENSLRIMLDPLRPNFVEIHPDNTNPTVNIDVDGIITFCLSEKPSEISCEGATESVKGAYFVPVDMTSEEFLAWYNQPNSTTLNVNGVETNYDDFLDVLVDMTPVEDIVPPEVIPEGYKVDFNIPWRWENKKDYNLRIKETVNGSDVIKIIYWDNPSAFENHVCLAAKEEF